MNEIAKAVGEAIKALANGMKTETGRLQFSFLLILLVVIWIVSGLAQRGCRFEFQPGPPPSIVQPTTTVSQPPANSQ